MNRNRGRKGTFTVTVRNTSDEALSNKDFAPGSECCDEIGLVRTPGEEILAGPGEYLPLTAFIKPRPGLEKQISQFELAAIREGKRDSVLVDVPLTSLNSSNRIISDMRFNLGNLNHSQQSAQKKVRVTLLCDSGSTPKLEDFDSSTNWLRVSALNDVLLNAQLAKDDQYFVELVLDIDVSQFPVLQNSTVYGEIAFRRVAAPVTVVVDKRPEWTINARGELTIFTLENGLVPNKIRLANEGSPFSITSATFGSEEIPFTIELTSDDEFMICPANFEPLNEPVQSSLRIEVLTEGQTCELSFPIRVQSLSPHD